MVVYFLRQLFSKEKMNSQRSPGQSSLVTNLPYHRHIRTLHTHFPHFESLSLYSQESEKLRVAGQLGSHDSDSILAAEIFKSGNASFHQINCYDHNDLEHYHEMLTGTGDASIVLSRVLVIEDLSPAAIEILGAGFDLDPHVFYFHLGFDTRRSAMVDLIDPQHESSIPVTWCMPSHAPENFISVPLPCNLKPLNARTLKSGLPTSMTYSRQAYRPITDLPEPLENCEPPQRAFHRVSLVFAQKKIQTIIILAFPTWKRISPVLSGLSKSSYNEVLDSYGFSLGSPANRSELSHLPGYHAVSEREFERMGAWNKGQWQRTQPLFQALIPLPSPQLELEPKKIRERALLWIYSKLNDNYFLACQNEGRCWRDLRAILDHGPLKDYTSQQPKRKFRDSMTKTIELMKISTDWLDKALNSANDQETYRRLRRKISVTMTYEEARLDQVLLNINDEQNEVQMKLMVQQLKESRYAINQSISVGQLTKLAFIFVPLSTVCSAFSMNLKEMNKPPPVWLFVVIAIVCTTAVAIISSERVRRVYKETLLSFRRRFKSVRNEKASW